MRIFTRTLSAALMMMFGAVAAQAKAVDENTARQVGANFLISKGVAGVNSSADLLTAYVASGKINGVSVADYYVFNVQNGNGFVIIAADDQIIPVLAYSNESALNMNNMAPATKDWIDGYKNQIAAAIAAGTPARAETPALWQDLQTPATRIYAKTTAVTPLLSTKWDQAPGYNNSCPNTASTGGLSVTGCVATAMAQLMKFWNWPTVGCGYHTYYDAYSSYEGSGSNMWNTANYGNTVYGWSTMPNTSSNSAVATLMFHAGVGVNMSYSSNESGAYVTLPETYPVNCAEYALKTYFHYSPSLHYLLRRGLDTSASGSGSYYTGPDYVYCDGEPTIDSINETTWINTLRTELNAGHPMLYEGQGAAGGHCWVCDGWETTGNMFHFNWGWSGSSDGYFTVDNLAPPALGIGGGGGNFNDGQGVILGIVPDSFPSNPGNIKLLAHLNTTTSSPMRYGTAFSISTKILNSGTTAFSGAFAVQLFDTGSNYITNVDSVAVSSVAAGDSTATLTFNCTPYAATSILYNGIRIAYQATGTSTWTPVANNGNFINYTIVGVENDTDIVLYDSLHLSSHSVVTGHAFSVTTSIGNQGNWGTGATDDFSGSVEAILVNTVNGDTFLIQKETGISIPYYSQWTGTFSTTGVGVAPGLYAVEIRHQYNGTGSFNTTGSSYFVNPVLMRVVSAPTDIHPSTAGDMLSVYPNPATDQLNVTTDGLHIKTINILDVQGRVVKSVNTDNQASMTIDLGNIAGGIYLMQAITEEGTVTKKITVIK